MNARSNYRDYITYSNKERFKTNNLTESSRAETFKKVETVSESDEELTKIELEKAVKEYKKNKCKHSETKYEAGPKSYKINERQSFFAKNFDDSSQYWTDLQELKNYFRTENISQKKKPVTKSYKSYEEQGAKPKCNTKNNSREIIESDSSASKSVKKLREKKYEKEQKIQSRGNKTKNKSFSVGPKISEAEVSLYNFIVNPACDDVIVKINEEICSTPFFYIVPNNPSPNFFFSPGSYYVIPKKPDYTEVNEEVIISHPENTSSGHEENDDLLKFKQNINGNITTCTGSPHEHLVLGMNNLGKNVSRKEDSHLNIGPLDAKVNESFNNLEISCTSNKTYEKALMNPVSFNAFNVVQKIKLTDRAEKSVLKRDENDLKKNSNRIEMLSDSLLMENERNLDENNAESNTEKRRERQEIDQNLMMEFLDSDQTSETATYIVPNNPSPKFFLSAESFYRIPKKPDYTEVNEEVIISHPENTSSGHEENDDLLKFKQNINDIITTCTGSSHEHLVLGMNNLGKNVSRKEDSHLNIGPLDAEDVDDVEDVSLIDENSFGAEEGLDLADEYLLERMHLALPEIRIEELQEKMFEFQGDENLIESYIQETKQVIRIRQLVLDMQFIFPDADPDFLYQEIEKFKYDENAINVLTEQLLESKTYPKISENNSNSESKNLWQKYVKNFSVKNFIHKVPNPQEFEGPNGDHNKANIEFILKFLMSRYPSESQDFLEQSFKSNNNNLTKTCMALAHLEEVRLSESTFQREAFNEAFLKEICYIDHKEEIDNYLEEIERKKNLDIEEARRSNTFLSCPLCAEEELIAYEVIACSEGHVFCKECIKRYIYVKLGDGIYRFLCPLDKCDAFFSHTNLEELLSESVLSTIIKKQQAEEINNAKVDGLEFCLYCEFAYIPNPEDKIFKCQNPECLRETCRKCKEKSHIPFRCEEIERSIDLEARKKIEETMTEQLIRSCPTCLKKFVKIDGCNKMVCSCGTMVCYFCRAKISGYDHFYESSYALKRKCPLYSNNEILHTRNVVEAGIQARNHILQNNPDIRILHDPTAN